MGRPPRGLGWGEVARAHASRKAEGVCRSELSPLAEAAFSGLSGLGARSACQSRTLT